MSPDEPVLTIDQHLWVREALHVVDEQARHVAGMLHVSPDADMVDDWRSVGKIALYDAVRRFDPERKRKLATFARYRVRGAILNTVRAEKRHARIELALARAVAFRMSEYTDDYDILRHSPEELKRRLDMFCDSAAAVMFAAGAAEACAATADDPLVAAGERHEHARAVAVLQELVRALEPEERSLLDMLFGLSFDLQKAADQLGVHKQTAWRRLQRLLESLRRELHTRYVREAPWPRNDVALDTIFPQPDEP